MPERTGSERPGGRTARTRRAVHHAVQSILSDPGADLSIPEVAARSGVHSTTIYRRWHTIESLVLDIAVQRVTEEAPVAATGDLRADLTAYVSQLLKALQRTGASAFLQALLAAAAHADGTTEITDIVQPRIRQLQALLDAAGVTRIDAMRLVEVIVAPAYFWTQLGVPLDPDRDAHRLIETALLACRG